MRASGQLLPVPTLSGWDQSNNVREATKQEFWVDVGTVSAGREMERVTGNCENVTLVDDVAYGNGYLGDERHCCHEIRRMTNGDEQVAGDLSGKHDLSVRSGPDRVARFGVVLDPPIAG